MKRHPVIISTRRARQIASILRHYADIVVNADNGEDATASTASLLFAEAEEAKQIRSELLQMADA